MALVAGRLLAAILIVLGTTGGGRPKLSLAVRPFAILKGQSTVATLQLSHVEGAPDFACPDIQWNWGDGSDSTTEGIDCASPDPSTAASPAPPRHVTSTHTYDTVGKFEVEVTVRPTKGDPLKASTFVNVTEEKFHLTTMAPLPH